jgi:adenine deaminase
MNRLMKKTENAHILSKVALGEVPPDTVISNGLLFNVFTREFIGGQSIWIKDGMIAYVGPDANPPKHEKTLVIDAAGSVLLPGLVDGHTHIFDRVGIEEFVKHVIPSGVTTVIAETIELATIVGKDGFEYVAQGLDDQPIRMYYTVSPLCALVPSQEINAPSLKEYLPLLKSPRCLGVGEVYWGNIFMKGNQGERVRRLVSKALDLGKRVEGHSAGAKGRKLQAYTCFGVSSCHEPITEDEILERLRLGHWVMIREGAIRKELSAIKGVFNKDMDFRRLILSTDGVDPEGFITEGYLDASVRSALKLGISPEIVYQMVTLNVAEHFRLDHLIGSLSPGKMADLVIIPSPDDFSPQLMMCGGKIIFKDGKATAQPRKITFPDYMFHTVRVDEAPFPELPTKGRVRVIELVTRLVTKERIIDLENPEESQDVITVLALNRLGSGKAFSGFLKGFGLQRGACGSTMCWDSVDMIVVGCDTRSMRTVIARLKEIGGGAVYAIGDEVIAEYPAPLCGVISLEPMETLREEIRQLEVRLRENGVEWENPLLTIDVLGTAAIPHIRITHQGYVRLRDGAVLSVET